VVGVAVAAAAEAMGGGCLTTEEATKAEDGLELRAFGWRGKPGRV